MVADCWNFPEWLRMNFTATVSSRWSWPGFLRITLRVLLLHCTRPIVLDGGKVLTPIMCFYTRDDNKSHQRLPFEASWPFPERNDGQEQSCKEEHHPGWTNNTKCNSLSSYMLTLLLSWHIDLCMDASVSLNTSISAFKEKVNLHPITDEATSPKKCVFIFFKFMNICKTCEVKRLYGKMISEAF